MTQNVVIEFGLSDYKGKIVFYKKISEPLKARGGIVLGAIEAGGTEIVCVVGDESGSILIRTQIPTTTPEEKIVSPG